MDISTRLREIKLCQELLGKYTAMVMMLYEDKSIDKLKYEKELIFIREKLLKVSGIDSEEVRLVNRMIKELNE